MGQPDRAKPPPGWSDQHGVNSAIPFPFLKFHWVQTCLRFSWLPHPPADSRQACRRLDDSITFHTCSCASASHSTLSFRCCFVFTIFPGYFGVRSFDQHKLLISAPLGWQGSRGSKLDHKSSLQNTPWKQKPSVILRPLWLGVIQADCRSNQPSKTSPDKRLSRIRECLR